MVEYFNRSSVEYKLQPLQTNGDGWGSREETRCEIDGEPFTFIAYYDDDAICCWKGLLLRRLHDAGLDKMVGAFVGSLIAAVPRQLRRGK